MSDNLSFLLTCAAECLNNWGYDGHGKHVDDGVKEITRLRAENEKLREALKTVCLGVVAERENLDWFIMDGAALRVARAAIREDN